MTEIKTKTDEMRSKISDAMSMRQEKMKESISNIQNQLRIYGDQIGDYLRKIDANVDDYRFTVEKIDEGISIDVMLKATIKKNDDAA